jgi:hypothetical protein
MSWPQGRGSTGGRLVGEAPLRLEGLGHDGDSLHIAPDCPISRRCHRGGRAARTRALSSRSQTPSEARITKSSPLSILWLVSSGDAVMYGQCCLNGGVDSWQQTAPVKICRPVVLTQLRAQAGRQEISSHKYF